MNYLQALVEKLDSDGFGAQGSVLFRDSMPEAIDEGILILSRTLVLIDPYVYEWRTGQFQVIVRGLDQDDIRLKLEDVITSLKSEGRLILSGICFARIWPSHSPLVYPRSEGNGLEGAISFDFIYIQS